MEILESAVEKLRELRSEENNNTLKFRVFVQGGGCSGMQYGFTFDENHNEDDFDFQYGDLTVLVDSMSWGYLQGAKIRWEESDMGSSFVIDNPNAQTSCGCGSSFSPAL
jgi:iron-sulfur cluster insertion protein